MKNLFIVLFSLMTLMCPAQTKDDIFNRNVQLVCFGADYSQVQFTKAEMFDNKPEILRLFVDCNNLINYKPWQEILRKKLKRDEIKTDFTYVTKVNAAVDWQNVFSDNVDFTLSDTVIENMIWNLNIDQALYKDQIGLVFCEENCSKTNKLGKVALVFFNVNDLKPLIIKHFSIKPNGFGLLFYWGSINLEAIKRIGIIFKELKK
jgi:hypothetical protein